MRTGLPLPHRGGSGCQFADEALAIRKLFFLLMCDFAVWRSPIAGMTARQQQASEQQQFAHKAEPVNRAAADC
jgi:hypothetical protein